MVILQGFVDLAHSPSAGREVDCRESAEEAFFVEADQHSWAALIRLAVWEVLACLALEVEAGRSKVSFVALN